MINDRVSLRTEALNGSAVTERRWLRDVGDVSALKCSWARNRGPTGCTFTIAVPPRWGRSRPDVLSRGRHLYVADGSYPLWGGRIEEVTPVGGGFAVRAGGWADAGQDYTNVAVATPGINSGTANLKLTGLPSSVNAAIDNAPLVGWPVTRADTFEGVPTVQQSMREQLDAAGLAFGWTWSVQPDRTVRKHTFPTTPSVLLTSLAEPASTTSQDYLTDLVGVFLDSTVTTYADQTNVRIVGSPMTSAPRVQRVLDLKPLGPMTPTAAIGVLTNTLGRAVPVPPILTGSLSVSAGQARNMGSTPISASRLGYLVGQIARVKGSQPSDAGDLTLYSTLDVVIDQVEWDADSDSASVLPLNGEARDLAGILAQATENTSPVELVGASL